MTGAEHYRQAEKLLANAWQKGGPNGDAFIRTDNQRDAMLVSAQAHATLALAAATALSQTGEMYVPDAEAWEQAASAHTRAAVPS